MQPYPRSPDLVWPRELHGTGCLSARALDTGFPTVVWCLCFGPCCAPVWVSVTPPVLAGVSGGCVRVRFVVLSLFCRLGFVVFAVGLGFRPAPHFSSLKVWDVRGCVCALPALRRSRFRCVVWACVLGSGFPLCATIPWGGVGVCVRSCARPAWSPAPPGWGCCAGVCGWCCAPPLLAGASVCVCVCARAPLVPRPFWLGCAVWVLGPGLSCAPPFLVGLSGCFFFFYGGVLCFVFVASVAGCPRPRPCGPCPPNPYLRARLLALFFISSKLGVCMRFSGVPLPGGPLLLVWCCRFWLGGHPVPLWASRLRCLLGGGFCRLLRCWWAVWWLWAVPSPPPLPLFFFGGGVCLFLPLPSLGWRTHWPAFSVVFRVAVGGCVLLGRVPAPWVGWDMYTLGSAPLPAGLGPGSACWAAAPGGFVWLWVRGGWGCPCPVSSAVVVLTFRVDRHSCCRARDGLVCGPRCQCVAHWCGAFRGVWWLVFVCPSG